MPNTVERCDSEDGTCRTLFDETSDEYLEYSASVRHMTGCESADLADCPAPIKLELMDYPSHISRKDFEDPDYHHYAHAQLRTTSSVGYKQWLSRYFSDSPPLLHPQGYYVEYRDSDGHFLDHSLFAKREYPGCSHYVVLAPGQYTDAKIAITGWHMPKLKGSRVLVRVLYATSLWGAPQAPDSAAPVVGAAVSNIISITVN